MRPARDHAVARIAVDRIAAGRGAARERGDEMLTELAGKLGRRPTGCWQVRHRDNRPPTLLLDGNTNGVQASLAHSGGWIAAAVTGRGAVGIDIESKRKLGRHRHIATFVGMPAGGDASLFLARWTLREAIAKATGGSVLEAHAAEHSLSAACEWPGSTVTAGEFTAMVRTLGDTVLAVVHRDFEAHE